MKLSLARPMLAVLCVLAVLLCAFALPGCQTLTNPDNRLAQQIAVQYATGKFIEAAPAAERIGRAQDVAKVVVSVKSMVSDGSASISQLHQYAMAKVNAAKLNPSDKLLATALVDVAVQELSARVSTGVLDPDARVAVHRLLDWVAAAAAAYG